ncbi:hypothetical protein ACMA5I_03190 [Paracoccaceae bacterium GXU_MW_L88]
MHYLVILFLVFALAAKAGEANRAQPRFPLGIEDIGFSASLTKSGEREARHPGPAAMRQAPPDQKKEREDDPLWSPSARVDLTINF